MVFNFYFKCFLTLKNVNEYITEHFSSSHSCLQIFYNIYTALHKDLTTQACGKQALTSTIFQWIPALTRGKRFYLISRVISERHLQENISDVSAPLISFYF